MLLKLYIATLAIDTQMATLWKKIYMKNQYVILIILSNQVL